MKAATTLLAIFSLGAVAFAAPVEESEGNIVDDGVELIARTELNARGYGCPWDSDQCAFHCRNDVIKSCNNGNQLKPTGGDCGGFGWATCKCIYSQNC